MSTVKIIIKPDRVRDDGSILECWDNVTITVRDDDTNLTTMYKFEDRADVRCAYQQILSAHVNNHVGPLQVIINNKKHIISEDVWPYMGEVLDYYMDLYIPVLCESIAI